MQTVAEHDYKVLYEQAELTINALTFELEKLKKMIFGSKPERFVASDDNKVNPQLTLDLDAQTIAACKITDATKVSYIRTNI